MPQSDVRAAGGNKERLRHRALIILSMQKIMPDLNRQPKPRAARALDIPNHAVTHIDALAGFGC